ncbi:DUF6325 family protein [Agromyces sp. Leaf222]|uniref:DUF6325 family protein n=1 Tax=Agromyces sp. Leaf222 TaxID=1735688 RepID=UPI0006FD8340|nr:DUF6325 family protein [Agromyces sp. Leaf222]KQM81917.1 hypothetical protein ASE68_00115 [Agromyces sp. Leaf222]
MADFEYGPVDLYLIGFEGDRPDGRTLEAIADLVDSGEIRLLDFLLVSRGEDEVTIVEFEDFGDQIEFDVEVLEAGLVGDEDVDDLAERIPVGSSAALIAIELVWAKKLASRFAESGAELLQVERIPAPIVNEILAEVEGAES